MKTIDNVCSRCGELYDSRHNPVIEYGGYELKKRRLLHRSKTQRTGYWTTCHDLCPECWESFDQWFATPQLDCGLDEYKED